MGLRAKKPLTNEQPRLKALIYAAAGSGKTHFCCSFPATYYIDTEKLEDYPHFVKMIADNQGDLVYLTELSEIIKEVKELMSVKHNYKTLIIDSLSFPYGWLTQMEAERLQRKSPTSEGTEYGANLSKAKRLTYQLGIMLSTLDMNIIVVSHERIKYLEGVEVGKTFDINEKMAYALGSVLNLRLQGKSRRLFIEKSRYPELKAGDNIEFDDGYKTLVKLFGEEIFVRESKPIELADEEQIKLFNQYVKVLAIQEEKVQTWLRAAKAPSIEGLNKEIMTKLLNHLDKEIKGVAE